MDSTNSEIAEFYKYKNILITGATGFIGKVLIEKLIRSCPEIKNIFVLIREKKDVKTSKRLQEMLNSPIYKDLREKNSQQLEKIVPISGDVKKEKLGLKVNDIKLLTENINIVFHVAATVRFDEPIKEAVETNVIGTNNLLELCQEMTEIQALVHVSTAYSYLFDRVVKERLYLPIENPETIITQINNLGEDVLDKMTPLLIGKYPNTYSYSKSLAESLVNKKKNNIPTSIFRPSIVVCAWKEPLRGWIDNTGGPTGMLAAMAKGVVQSLYTDTEASFDIIPVDIVVNNLIAVGWNTGVTRPKEVNVYNCSSTCANPITMKSLADHYQRNMKERPVTNMMWYPRCIFEKNKGMHNLRVLVFQTIPAILLDTIARLVGAKPIAKKIQDKVTDRLKSLEYFITKEWFFDNTNSMELYWKLNSVDKEIFYFNLQDMDWTEFLEGYWLGVRKFILKEELEMVPKARIELRRWYWIDRFYLAFIMFIIIFGLYFYFSMIIKVIGDGSNNHSNSADYKPKLRKLVP